MSDKMNFDLEPRIEEVTIGGKEYELREASGDAASKYRNSMLDNTELHDGEARRIKGMADVEPLLVSLCLFEKKSESQYKRVSLETVRGWPSRIIKPLSDRIKEISDLNEGATDRELLGRALAVEGAPCTLARLREYVCELVDTDEEYAQLAKWLKPTAVEKAKNDLSVTGSGST